MYNLMSLALIVPHKIADTATMGHVGQTKWRPPFDQCGRKKSRTHTLRHKSLRLEFNPLHPMPMY